MNRGFVLSLSLVQLFFGGFGAGAAATKGLWEVCAAASVCSAAILMGILGLAIGEISEGEEDDA